MWLTVHIQILPVVQWSPDPSSSRIPLEVPLYVVVKSSFLSSGPLPQSSFVSHDLYVLEDCRSVVLYTPAVLGCLVFTCDWIQATSWPTGPVCLNFPRFSIKSPLFWETPSGWSLWYPWPWCWPSQGIVLGSLYSVTLTYNVLEYRHNSCSC